MSSIRRTAEKSVVDSAGNAPTFRSPGPAWSPALGRLGHGSRGDLRPVRCRELGRRNEMFPTPSRPTGADFLMDTIRTISQFVAGIDGCEPSGRDARNCPAGEGAAFFVFPGEAQFGLIRSYRFSWEEV